MGSWTRLLQMAPDYDHLTLMEKVEVFEHAVNNTAGDDLAKLLWLKSPSSEVSCPDGPAESPRLFLRPSLRQVAQFSVIGKMADVWILFFQAALNKQAFKLNLFLKTIVPVRECGKITRPAKDFTFHPWQWRHNADVISPPGVVRQEDQLHALPGCDVHGGLHPRTGRQVSFLSQRNALFILMTRIIKY